MGMQLGLVMLGAGIGAGLRYLIIYHWPTAPRYYTAIWAVNVFGALLMGLLTGLGWTGNTFLFAGTGALGGLTTFSTMMTQSRTKPSRVSQFYYLIIQVLTGLLGFYLGLLGGQNLH